MGEDYMRRQEELEKARIRDNDSSRWEGLGEQYKNMQDATTPPPLPPVNVNVVPQAIQILLDGRMIATVVAQYNSQQLDNSARTTGTSGSGAGGGGNYVV
jgi:hypothetical protein